MPVVHCCIWGIDPHHKRKVAGLKLSDYMPAAMVLDGRIYALIETTMTTKYIRMLKKRALDRGRIWPQAAFAAYVAGDPPAGATIEQ